LRSNTKRYGGKIHYTDSQNNHIIAPNGREFTICSSRSRRPGRKLLGILWYNHKTVLMLTKSVPLMFNIDKIICTVQLLTKGISALAGFVFFTSHVLTFLDSFIQVKSHHITTNRTAICVTVQDVPRYRSYIFICSSLRSWGPCVRNHASTSWLLGQGKVVPLLLTKYHKVKTYLLLN